MKHYIGIDPSITALGIAIATPGKPDFTNTFGFKKDDDRHFKKSDRYVLLAQNIFFDIEKQIDHQDGDELVFMFEGFIMAGKGRICDMAELAGFLKCYLMTHMGYSRYKRIRVYEIPPTSLKQWLTGKGNASKEMMAEHAFELWGKRFLDDKGKADSNQCDAYALLQLMKWIDVEDDNTGYKVERDDIVKALVRFA